MSWIVVKARFAVAVFATAFALSGLGADGAVANTGGRAVNEKSAAATMDAAMEINMTGLRLLSEGKTADAMVKFREAIAVFPACAPAAHNLAKLSVSAGKVADAREVLERFVSVAPDDIQGRALLVQVYALESREDDARSMLSWLKSNGCVRELSDIAAFLAARKSYSLANEVADLALSVSPKDAQALYNKAAIVESEGDLKRAEELYRKALAVRRDATTLLALAVLMEKSGDVKSAKALFEEAYATEVSPETQYNLGRFLFFVQNENERGLKMMVAAAKGDGFAAHSARKTLLALRELARKEEVSK